jgi:hypothetical protein
VHWAETELGPAAQDRREGGWRRLIGGDGDGVGAAATATAWARRRRGRGVDGDGVGRGGVDGDDAAFGHRPASFRYENG